MAQPNIVLLLADQQKATSLGLYGNADVETPALEALAQRGVVFESYFTPHPFCLPARCILMTGRYAHAIGVHGNGFTLPHYEVTLAERLGEVGYQTGAIGHFHGGRSGGGRGFAFQHDIGKGILSERSRLRRELVEKAPRRVQHMVAEVPLPADEDLNGAMTTLGMNFVDSCSSERPFFLHIAYMDPHPPFFVPEPYFSLYDPAEIAMPPVAGPNADKPEAHEQTARDCGTWDADEKELRKALAVYYGMVRHLDDQVARLVSFLEMRGLLDNTVIIYSSDHGDYAGEHRMFGKSCTLYDCLVRIPAIIAGPDHLVPQGEQIAQITDSTNLAPTVLDWIGVDIPETMHGRSFVPVWEGREQLRNVAFAEVGAFPAAMVNDPARGNNLPFGPPASGRQTEISTMVRTPEWKLVYTPGREHNELYNLRADPWELRNRYSDSEVSGVVAELRQQLMDWYLSHH
ncbi:MAG: sulfatase-like hydrolase/transferase [Chloroflexota bacterium]|nr:sulfatase-like hydrolase/transferase [Chloroflexota bacterium]MDE2841255.1 sulfatase-like hydrolase/transferase [Chloroflexota bacterium]